MPVGVLDGRTFLDRIGRDWPALQETEWLATNGLGGYASGTVSGANTRRYHGLLVAAFTPPGDRWLMLAKVEERLKTAEGHFELAASQWQDQSIAPQGYRYLTGFLADPMPTWTYQAGGATLTKQLWLIPGRNAVQLRYSLSADSPPADLEIAWLVNHRDPHGETTGRADVLYQQMLTDQGVLVQAYAGAHPLAIAWERGEYSRTDVWYYRFYHAREAERGLWATEDHYSPGTSRVTLAPGESVTFTAAAESRPHALSWQGDVPTALGTPVDQDPVEARLARSAAAYLVQRRQPPSTSVIAGYPWFGEWGRDAMIALPGLTLVTGRHDQAREILATFIHFMDQGVLPNTFPDDGSDPVYNTIDATMWLFWAFDRYWAYTRDDAFLKLVFPRLAGAIDWYSRGTHHGIHMDSDGLITGASPGRALTWMDAVVGDWVVTPRAGKPVEVNALWIHALRVMSAAARRLGEPDPYKVMAEKAAASFTAVFWQADWGGLADRITPEGEPERFWRPNQVFACAVPDPWLPLAVRRRILDGVEQRLWTPYGLRSLAPGEPGYHGVYAGDRVQRDGAYHQGTVWSWLIGPYATACLRAAADEAAERERWRQRVQPLLDHVDLEGCLGHVAELFDGDPPHRPKGALAQAWSMAELLRVWVEEVQGQKPLGLTEV
jgi:predicted glycogen debranching enzyme